MRRNFGSEDDDEMEIEVEIEGESDSIMNTQQTDRVGDQNRDDVDTLPLTTDRLMNAPLVSPRKDDKMEVGVEIDANIEIEVEVDIVDPEIENNLQEQMVDNQNVELAFEVGGNAQTDSQAKEDSPPFWKSNCGIFILTSIVFACTCFIGVCSYLWINHGNQNLKNGFVNSEDAPTWWVGIIFFGIMPIVLLLGAILLCYCTLSTKTKPEETPNTEETSDAVSVVPKHLIKY